MSFNREGGIMSTSNLIKNLCKEKGISVAELARRIGQTPQNFNKKLKRETVSTEELMEIAEVLGVVFEQSYILENGEKLTITSESQ
jgi:hypothetical protein